MVRVPRRIWRFAMKFFLSSILIASISVLSSCQTGGPIAGNEGGSMPINDQEAHEMQKSVNRCHRTGGTRVVKIKGELKCF